jgi:chromosome segregation ATPase
VKGPNTFAWDFRYAPPAVLPDAVFQGQAAGALAAPGSYRVELTVAGHTYSQPFRIVKDPRVPYTDAELEEQFQFMKRVTDRLEQTMGTVRRIREMRKRAEDLVAKARQQGKDPVKLDTALKALNDRLYLIEERLVQFRARAGEDLINYPTGIDSKLARLLDFASMADAPPTEGEKELYGRLSEGISDRIRLLDQVEKNEYASVVSAAGGN